MKRILIYFRDVSVHQKYIWRFVYLRFQLFYNWTNGITPFIKSTSHCMAFDVMRILLALLVAVAVIPNIVCPHKTTWPNASPRFSRWIHSTFCDFENGKSR